MNKYEKFALWYLRLNGYLTAPNFIIHSSRGQKGEVDILGVRFPHSSEVVDGGEMKNDINLVRRDDKIDFVIVEVTSRECKLNGTWKKKTHKDRRKYVVSWLGIVPSNKLDSVADRLYSEKQYEDDKWAIRLVCLGNNKSLIMI